MAAFRSCTIETGNDELSQPHPELQRACARIRSASPACWRPTRLRRWDASACAQLAPSRDRQWIERQQQLTEELRGYLRAGGRFDFHGLLDPTQLIDKSRIRGAVLELAEIRDLLLLADRAAEWREIALHPTANVAETLAGGARTFREHRRLHAAAALLRQQDSSRRHARRSRLAGAGAHSPRHRKAEALHPGIAARLSAAALRRRRRAGRAGHDSRRPLRHPGEGGAAPARAGRRPRSVVQRSDGLHRAAGDDRAEQRSGAPAGRRAGGDSSHPAGDDCAAGRARRRAAGSGGDAGRAGAAIRQGPLRRRLTTVSREAAGRTARGHDEPSENSSGHRRGCSCAAQRASSAAGAQR